MATEFCRDARVFGDPRTWEDARFRLRNTVGVSAGRCLYTPRGRSINALTLSNWSDPMHARSLANGTHRRAHKLEQPPDQPAIHPTSHPTSQSAQQPHNTHAIIRAPRIRPRLNAAAENFATDVSSFFFHSPSPMLVFAIRYSWTRPLFVDTFSGVIPTTKGNPSLKPAKRVILISSNAFFDSSLSIFFFPTLAVTLCVVIGKDKTRLGN